MVLEMVWAGILQIVEDRGCTFEKRDLAMSLRVRLQLEPTPEQLSPRPERRPQGPVDLNETLPWLPYRQVRPERSEPQVRCIHCDGRMAPGTVPVHIEKEGYRASWDALPAWICSRCETPYFEEQEVLLVQSTLALMKPPAKKTVL
jgi:hypothetical protein